MIPNVFVSSTILDLHHLREAIRESILELGFNPVMSEYGDVGYLSTHGSAADACYMALKDCQISIFIVGKRYGDLTDNNISVTQSEFNTAKKENIPTIAMIERDVLAYMKVYEVNKDNANTFPGMDNPKNTFNFVELIKSSPTYNGVVPFSTASEARVLIKKHISHYIGDILRRRLDPVNYQIRDVLSELKVLKQELKEGSKDGNSSVYLRAFKYLLDDRNEGNILGSLIDNLVGGIDDAVPIMLRSSTFDEFLMNIGVNINIVSDRKDIPMDDDGEGRKLVTMSSWIISFNPEDLNKHKSGIYGIYTGNRILMNEDAKNWFAYSFDKFRKLSLRGGKLTIG